ncbi:MAG TPA: DUF5930 domain-containing protein, partial [Caulobacteraceae bacterium]|nr:DUF5930 domain-containing protein [Caulobacteraceae bacterium]
MVFERLSRLRRAIEGLFPERHIYVRSGGELHAHVLTTGRQIALAGGVGVAVLWMTVSTAAVLIQAVSPSAADRAAARTRAYDERLIADREARLNSAVAQLSDSNGSLNELARSVESRHAALAILLTSVRGDPGAAQALTPTPISAAGGANPLATIHAVENDQDRLVDRAETFAKSRADRLRLAFRLAGLDPSAFSRVDGDGLGGPLIEQKDPRALAAVLDVDEEFAQRIQHAATELSNLNGLASTAQDIPLARPTTDTRQA